MLSSARLFLVDRSRLPTAVVAAVRTHTMRWPRLVTMGAFAEADGRQRVVRAALGGTGLGVSSLWIRHRLRILS